MVAERPRRRSARVAVPAHAASRARVPDLRRDAVDGADAARAPRGAGRRARPRCGAPAATRSCCVALVLLMVATGGLVAGIRAGFAYNTFPLMNGHLVPPEVLMLEPAWRNFFWNMATVQFDHRALAAGARRSPSRGCGCACAPHPMRRRPRGAPRTRSPRCSRSRRRSASPPSSTSCRSRWPRCTRPAPCSSSGSRSSSRTRCAKALPIALTAPNGEACTARRSFHRTHDHGRDPRT